MKDKAVYKHGMHGDRSPMGKKAVHRKMGDYFPQQSDYLTEDGRAIDASKPKAQMKEAGAKQTGGDEKQNFSTKTATTTLDNNKTISLSKSKSYTINEFGEKEFSGSGGGAGNVNNFLLNPETGSSDAGGINPRTSTRSKQRVPGTTTYINPKGKERTAKSGTLKAKALETIYNIRSKHGKFRSTEKYSPEEKVYNFKGGKEIITRS